MLSSSPKTDQDLKLAQNFGLCKQILWFLFKKNMFSSLIKYLSKCTCIRKVKRQRKSYLYSKEPPDIKVSKLKLSLIHI